MSKDINCVVYTSHAERLRCKRVINSCAGLRVQHVINLSDLASPASLEADVAILVIDTLTISYLEVISNAVQHGSRAVVIFCDGADGDAIELAPKKGITSTIVQSYTTSRIPDVVSVAIARQKFLDGLTTELMTTKRRLEERQLVERAKGQVMQVKKVSEVEAYDMLRKLAMNESIPLGMAATKVLETDCSALN